MADNPVPGPQLPADDPFDLGDTGLSFTKAEAEAAKPKPPQGPDGRFVSPKPAEPAPAAQPQHPPSLVRQAVDFGMDEDLIASLPTPQLYRTVNLFLTREREIAKSFNLQNTLDANRVAQPAPAPPAAAEPPDPLDGLVQDGFDPRLIEAVKKARDGPAEELKALREQLAQRDQVAAQRDMAEKVRILDAAFKKLGAPILGEGTGAELAKAGKQAECRRRIAVINAAGITDMSQVERFTIMSKLREAYELLYGAAPQGSGGDVYSAGLQARETPRAANPPVSPEEWANGGVAKPSQRNGAAEPKGEALAIKNLTERFRQEQSQHTDDAELEGLPD